MVCFLLVEVESAAQKTKDVHRIESNRFERVDWVSLHSVESSLQHQFSLSTTRSKEGLKFAPFGVIIVVNNEECCDSVWKLLGKEIQTLPYIIMIGISLSFRGGSQSPDDPPPQNNKRNPRQQQAHWNTFLLLEYIAGEKIRVQSILDKQCPTLWCIKLKSNAC